MVKKDYYEILEVKKTDSSETIKKSYKKLALKYHPDKASEDKKKEHETKFKEINEAYSTIGDEEKRKRYDLGGNSQFGGGGNFQGGDMSDFFRDLLRNGSFGGQFSDDEEIDIDQDLRYSLTITFKEAVFGCEKEVFIKKDIFCKICNGTGSKDGKFNNCHRCNGHGKIKINQRTPFGLISQVARCESCEGTGKIPENKCDNCKNKGILSSKEKAKINIPAGIDNDQTLRVPNGGNAAKNKGMGDLFLTMRVMPDKIFKRERYDVYIETPISFSLAALGGEINIPILSGEEIKIKIAKGTESGSVLRLKDRGVPHLNSSNRFGDQFVKIIVKTPKKLSKAQAKLFEELAKLDK